MDTIELYDYPDSVCCQKLRLILAEKQIDPIEHHVALDEMEQFSPEFLKLNPKAVVPVAVHKGKVITESTIIAEYIEDAFPDHPLLSEDPYWRARSRYWSLQLDSGIHNPHTTFISFVIAFRNVEFFRNMATREELDAYLAAKPDPSLRESLRQVFELGFDAACFRASVKAYDSLVSGMNEALFQSPWLGGENPSLGDFSLAPYIYRLDCLGLSNMWAERKNVAGWYENLKSRPSWEFAIRDRRTEDWPELIEIGGTDPWDAAQAVLSS